MLNFFAAVLALGLLLCFGVQGTLERTSRWGKEMAEETQRVYCQYHREDCDYLERVRLEVEAERARMKARVKRGPLKWRLDPTPEEQWKQLEQRSQKL